MPGWYSCTPPPHPPTHQPLPTHTLFLPAVAPKPAADGFFSHIKEQMQGAAQSGSQFLSSFRERVQTAAANLPNPLARLQTALAAWRQP